jgi:hypothetical protein
MGCAILDDAGKQSRNSLFVLLKEILVELQEGKDSTQLPMLN